MQTGLLLGLQAEHYHTLEHITTQDIWHFYEDESITVMIPTPTGWEEDLKSFRDLGSEFARRVSTPPSS